MVEQIDEQTGKPEIPPPPAPPPPPTSPIYGLSRGFNTARPTFESIRLHFAINHEDSEEIEKQAKRPDVNINFVVHGNTPLMLAALRRQYDVMLMLIELGADVNIPEEYPWKRQPIHLAAMADQAKVVGRLLEHGASVQALDAMRMTPLHWAASYGAAGVVRLLLAKGADPEARDDRGKTPLFRAAISSRDAVVDILAEVGCSVNVHDVYGWTALHQAAFCNLPVTEHLLRLGADCNAADLRGNTALHLMVRHRDRENLAIVARSDVQFYTRDRKITSSCTQGVKEFLDDRRLLQALLDYGLDPDAENRWSLTALDLAAAGGEVSFIRWLVSAGARIDPDGWPQALLENEALCAFLCERATCRVRPLKEMCKFAIRKYLRPVISASIETLPLPAQLKQYLLVHFD